ncbi:DUF1214 domain-containing protein [Streptosporangium saharense]|uniref:DUF1214 domain-containing protein n=1 Tax=Streptosporangium saharense TaxID=1706840 RepID=UPI00369F5508
MFRYDTRRAVVIPRVSLGDDGSLALTVGGDAPDDPERHANWLPAPADDFTLYLRAYWLDTSVVDGSWRPSAVVRGR